MSSNWKVGGALKTFYVLLSSGERAEYNFFERNGGEKSFKRIFIMQVEQRAENIIVEFTGWYNFNSLLIVIEQRNWSKCFALVSFWKRHYRSDSFVKLPPRDMYIETANCLTKLLNIH